MPNPPRPDAELVEEIREARDWLMSDEAEADCPPMPERDVSLILTEAADRIAALAQQVADARATANEVEARMNALRPFVVHEDGAHKVLLHNFDVMVAFYGLKELPHRWDDLLAALGAPGESP